MHYVQEMPKIFNLFSSVTLITSEEHPKLKGCIGMQGLPYPLIPGACFEIVDEQLIWEIKHKKGIYE